MRTYQIESRNGNHAIDEYDNGRCIRNVINQTSRKHAETVAWSLNDAYRHGRTDVLRGVGDRLTEHLERAKAGYETQIGDATWVGEAEITLLETLLAELEAFK